jgi:hypothetical protein
MTEGHELRRHLREDRHLERVELTFWVVTGIAALLGGYAIILVMAL